MDVNDDDGVDDENGGEGIGDDVEQDDYDDGDDDDFRDGGDEPVNVNDGHAFAA